MPRVAVAIVGAGACGLTAAIALREAGIDCVLLERDARASGSTGLSSGLIPAAPTPWQLQAGVADSVEHFAADIQAKARGRAAAHLVQAYASASAAALSLLARHGLVFELQSGFVYPGHSVRRMHSLRERTGAALMAALQRAAQGLGADVLTGARVVTLQPMADRRGWCVNFERSGGQIETLQCGLLLLACNGFGGDAQMVARYLPEMRGAPFAGHAGNDGSAIRWGLQLGAGLADLGGSQGHGAWAVPQGALISWALMVQGGVQINSLGQRFHDESQGYSEAAAQVLAQPGGVAWCVFDDQLLALARSFPDFCDAEQAGVLRSAPDAAQLALRIGCEAQALRATLQSMVPGALDAFGRRIARSLQEPLHAVKVTGALFHTQGGLDIDARCRVLREDGSVLPDLLAAGGAARGVSGDRLWGYLSGNGLLSAVAGGFIAAHTMAQQLKLEEAS